MITLPALILYEDHANNWDIYLEVIYSAFYDDFIKEKPVYKGLALKLKAHPYIEGKEATFWHLITKGLIEAERTPEIPRCERIKWPRPIIDNSHKVQDVKIWENTRNTKKGVQERICLCYGDWEYLVVLNKRKGFLLPWTAYPVIYNNDKRKLEKEYNKYYKISNI